MTARPDFAVAESSKGQITKVAGMGRCVLTFRSER